MLTLGGAPELRERLVALRSQKAELGRDIARLQDNLQTGELELSPGKLRTLSMEMRKRLADGPISRPCRRRGDVKSPLVPSDVHPNRRRAHNVGSGHGLAHTPRTWLRRTPLQWLCFRRCSACASSWNASSSRTYSRWRLIRYSRSLTG